MVDRTQILEALKGVNDPELGKSLVELGMVHDVEVEDSQVRFTLALTTLACPLRERIVDDARQAVLTLDGVQDVEVTLREMTPQEKERIWPSQQQQQQQRGAGVAAHLNRVKRVLAVMSGKGGVGKSSVAAILATAFRQQGKRVGVLDLISPALAFPRCSASTSHRRWGRLASCLLRRPPASR